MKHVLEFSSNRRTCVTGLILVCSTVCLLSDLCAQEAQPPSDRDPTQRADSPGTALLPARSRWTRTPPGTGLRPPTAVVPARFEATVYELQLPNARVADFEAPAIAARAATGAELLQALAEFGETKVLYKIDQTVNLYGESITMGSREPMVTGSRQTGAGGAINSVTYQEVGLIVNLAANPSVSEAPSTSFPVQVSFELSALADTGIEIAPSVRAARIRNLQLSHSETPRYGTPVVLLNASATPGTDQAPLTANIVRYVFHETTP